jgi:hypothetical protein
MNLNVNVGDKRWQVVMARPLSKDLSWFRPLVKAGKLSMGASVGEAVEY